MKKFLVGILFIVVLVGAALYMKTDKETTMRLTIGNENIQYITLENVNAVSANNKGNMFKEILERYSLDELKYAEFGEAITLDFGDSPPEEIAIKDIIINSKGDYLLNEKLEKEVSFIKDKNKYRLIIEKNYSSGFHQQPGQKIILRGYRIDAYWHKLEYSYAFVIKTPPIVYLE